MTSLSPAKEGSGKWWVGFVAAFLATFTVDHMEKGYGVNFREFNMDPAIFKGLLEGSFVSFLVWLTPSHLVQSITDGILFVRSAWKNWRDAANKPLN